MPTWPKTKACMSYHLILQVDPFKKCRFNFVDSFTPIPAQYATNTLLWPLTIAWSRWKCWYSKTTLSYPWSIFFTRTYIVLMGAQSICQQNANIMIKWYLVVHKKSTTINCKKSVVIADNKIVKKVRKSVIVMQRRFCVYVCTRITRQRVRERESLNQSYIYCLLHALSSYKELV